MTDAVLQVDRVSKRFGALEASKDVTLDLRSGEIHALIGPNGAGKSTLIAQIAGSLRPDSGRIRFLGRDVTVLDTVARAKLGLARSFQISATLPDFTVLQNVLLCAQGGQGGRFGMWFTALSQHRLRRFAEAQVDRVGLGDRAAQRAAELSHGERRRLELAMALALGPRAFLLDEPMAGLDAGGTQEMTALLAALRREAPILLVEHDMDAVFTLADRISVLDYGSIIASGTVAEIRAHPDVRRAYLGEEA